MNNSKETLVWRGEFPLYLAMSTEQKRLDKLYIYQHQVGELREFFKGVYSHPKDHEDYNWEETDFSSFTVGFLVAKGVPTLEAFMLDIFLRYTLEYFGKDPEINPGR